MPNFYTNLLFHVVCSTKNRRPLIGDDWRGEFDKYVGGLVREKDRIVGAPWYSVRSAILVEMNNAGPTGLGTDGPAGLRIDGLEPEIETASSLRIVTASSPRIG